MTTQTQQHDTIQPCPLCGKPEALFFFAVNGYNLAKCKQCTAIYVSPMPSDFELELHYQREEYFAGAEDQGYRDYSAVKKALLPHFKRRLQTLNHHFPEKGLILDFGCAAGYFLEVAQRAGWQIIGVELSTSMAKEASQTLGIPIATTLDTIPHRSVQALTLWEVIEHLPRPVDTLRSLREILVPGGALMLSTPNTAHWQAASHKEMWTAYRPPSHLLYFTPSTLYHALEAAGFVDITIQRVGPLPRFPRWLSRITASLQAGLADGSARPWKLSLMLWRVIRLFAWGWQRLNRNSDDVHMTLEALAFRPR